MRFLDKLFSKKDYPQKTAEMIDENLYWDIITQSLNHTTNQSSQEEYIIYELEKLSPKEIIGFRLSTDYLSHELHDANMWCAAYIIKGGCSDDGFDYFKNWVISRGKKTYYTAKQNPDSLVNEVIHPEDDYEFELFHYVAEQAFENKTQQPMDEYIDYDNFMTNERNYISLEFNWAEDNPESMRRICPKLYNKFVD